MQKHYAFLTLALLFTGTLSFAQTIFTPGYIIDAKGDTITGLVDKRSEYRNSQTASFKVTAESPVQEFSPAAIQGYKVGDRIYQSTLLEQNGQPTAVFLELINDGKLKFLYWQDQKDLIHFYVQKDTSLYELKNEKLQTEQKGRTFSYNSNEYLGLLKALTNDCNFSGPDRISYGLKGISAYVAKYNACQGNISYTSEKTTKAFTFNKSAFLSTNSSHVVTTGDARFSGTNRRTSLGGGIGLHMNMPSVNEKIFFDILAEYNRKGGVAEAEKISFDLHYLNITPGLSYVYPKGKIRPTVGGGFVVGYLLNSETAYLSTVPSRERRIFVTSYNNSEVKYEMGYEARLGLKYSFTSDLMLVLQAKYAKTLIPFGFSGSSYRNEVTSLQVGIEF